jgi:hypothetical protein
MDVIVDGLRDELRVVARTGKGQMRQQETVEEGSGKWNEPDKWVATMPENQCETSQRDKDRTLEREFREGERNVARRRLRSRVTASFLPTPGRTNGVTFV